MIKKLAINFSSLTALQISNYVFPLITFPYLVRVLGPEKYGLISFIFAFITYFIAFIEYGFNTSATRQIALNKNDKEKISKIFWGVIFSKILLFIFSTITFIIIIYFFDQFHNYRYIYLLAYLSTIHAIIFPQWFLLGVEKMKILFFITIPIKFIFTIAIFVFITTEADWKLLILLNTLTYLLIGLVAFIIVVSIFNIYYELPRYLDIKQTLIDGLKIFLSIFSISAYSSNNILLLGLFTNNKIVGLFAIADKIRLFMQIVPTSISDSFFPHISSLYFQSKVEARNLVKRYFYFIISITIAISLSVFMFSELIIEFILGKEYSESSSYLRILTWVPIVVAGRDTIGRHIMLNLKMESEYMNTFLIALFFSFFISVFFIPLYFAVASSFILLITEILIFGIMLKKTRGYFDLSNVF